MRHKRRRRFTEEIKPAQVKEQKPKAKASKGPQSDKAKS